MCSEMNLLILYYYYIMFLGLYNIKKYLSQLYRNAVRINKNSDKALWEISGCSDAIQV